MPSIGIFIQIAIATVIAIGGGGAAVRCYTSPTASESLARQNHRSGDIVLLTSVASSAFIVATVVPDGGPGILLTAAVLAGLIGTAGFLCQPQADARVAMLYGLATSVACALAATLALVI